LDSLRGALIGPLALVWRWGRARPVRAVLGMAALVGVAVWAWRNPEWLNILHAWLNRLVMHGGMWYAMHPWTTVAAFVGVFAVASALALPGNSILALGAGAVFGAGLGTVLVTVASALGAMGPFALARRFGRERLVSRYPGWWRQVDVGMHAKGARYLLLLRLAPVIPFALINPLMGLTTMRPWTFFWVSAVGMAAGSAVYAMAGAGVAFWAQG
jgi:uncharacterized membrane protein YdjX (TVP38/TMEM64 family)